MGKDRRVLGIIVFIAGILALIGFFTPWVKTSSLAFSAEASAWDYMRHSTVLGEGVEFKGGSVFALIGVVLFLGYGLFYTIAKSKRDINYGPLVLGGFLQVLALFGFTWISRPGAYWIRVFVLAMDMEPT